MLQIETVGIHVVTIPGDAGVAIGRSKRTYIFLRPSAQPVCGINLIDSSNAGFKRISFDQMPPLDELGKPLVSMNETLGFAVRLDTAQFGGTLGLHRSVRFGLPNSFDGWVSFGLVIENPSNTQFHVGLSAQGDKQ